MPKALMIQKPLTLILVFYFKYKIIIMEQKYVTMMCVTFRQRGYFTHHAKAKVQRCVKW